MMIKMSMKEARAISPRFPFKHFTFWVVLDALAMVWKPGNFVTILPSTSVTKGQRCGDFPWLLIKHA